MPYLPLTNFACFVGWLLLFPMGGISLDKVALHNPLAAFLVPQVVGLVLIGRFHPTRRFSAWSAAFTGFTMIMTIVYPLVPAAAPVIMPLVGLSSAFVSIRCCAFLKQGENPLIQAGAGLILGNLVLCLGLLIPAPATLKSAGAAALLLFPLLTPGQAVPTLQTGRNRGLFRYLPFVFVYQLVTGIMYGSIMPAFSQVGIARGGELFFYMAAVGAGILLFRLNREYLLALGILLAMLSLTCFLGSSPLRITLSMYAMQASAGCVDIFVLGYLLSFRNPLAAFGIGNGTICLGLFGGHQLSVWLGPPSTTLVMTGCLILIGTVLALYFSERQGAPKKPEATSPQGLNLAKAILSGREFEVLNSVATGKTYKAAAAELSLSESTVKTYMKRIYDKYGVTSKKELLKKVYEE